MSHNDAPSGPLPVIDRKLRRFMQSILWERRREIISFVLWLVRKLSEK